MSKWLEMLSERFSTWNNDENGTSLRGVLGLGNLEPYSFNFVLLAVKKGEVEDRGLFYS